MHVQYSGFQYTAPCLLKFCKSCCHVPCIPRWARSYNLNGPEPCMHMHTSRFYYTRIHANPHTEKMLFQHTQLPFGHGLASAGTLQANVDTIAIKDTSHVQPIWMIFQSWQDKSWAFWGSARNVLSRQHAEGCMGQAMMYGWGLNKSKAWHAHDPSSVLPGLSNWFRGPGSAPAAG